MPKPIIQIKIEGPQGSGKTRFAKALINAASSRYKIISPASSYDDEDSCHLEDDFHIVQIRTRQTRKEVTNG